MSDHLPRPVTPTDERDLMPYQSPTGRAERKQVLRPGIGKTCSPHSDFGARGSLSAQSPTPKENDHSVNVARNIRLPSRTGRPIRG